MYDTGNPLLTDFLLVAPKLDQFAHTSRCNLILTYREFSSIVYG